MCTTAPAAVSWSITAPSPKLSSSGWAITASALGHAGIAVAAYSLTRSLPGLV